MISLLIWLLILVIVLVVVFYIIDLLPLPPPIPVIVKLIIALVALLLILQHLLPRMGVALGRDLDGRWAQADPETKKWFQDQTVPGSTMRCCDEADGEIVQEDIKGGDYWIISEHFPEWTKVPEARIIRGPNKYGKPVVWYGVMNDVFYIRCYSPGAGI